MRHVAAISTDDGKTDLKQFSKAMAFGTMMRKQSTTRAHLLIAEEDTVDPSRIIVRHHDDRCSRSPSWIQQVKGSQESGPFVRLRYPIKAEGQQCRTYEA